MPRTRAVRIGVLIRACQNMELLLRWKGEVVGAISRDLPGGSRATIDVSPALATSITAMSRYSIDHDCQNPPWCGCFDEIFGQLGQGAGLYRELLRGLDAFRRQVPVERRTVSRRVRRRAP